MMKSHLFIWKSRRLMTILILDCFTKCITYIAWQSIQTTGETHTCDWRVVVTLSRRDVINNDVIHFLSQHAAPASWAPVCVWSFVVYTTVDRSATSQRRVVPLCFTKTVVCAAPPRCIARYGAYYWTYDGTYSKLCLGYSRVYMGWADLRPSCGTPCRRHLWHCSVLCLCYSYETLA